MDDKLLGLDITQSAITLGFSIATIQSVLGLTMLIIQLAFIAFRGVWTIYTYIKNKQYDKVADQLVIIQDDLIKLLKEYEEKLLVTTDEQERADLEEKIANVNKLINK